VPPQGLLATDGRALTLLVSLLESYDPLADIGVSLSSFVASCVSLLNVTAAATLIADHRGRLSIASWSSERARLFASAELDAGGPSGECHGTGDRRAYPTYSVLAARWPHLAEVARSFDIAAVYAIPLRHHDEMFGVLTLLDRRPDRLSGETLSFVDVLAAAVAAALAGHRTIDHHQRTTAQLQSALISRVAIEQAKGMLAERLGVSVDAAFDLLRSHARGNNRNLHEAATKIIDHSLDLPPLPRAPSA